jgi:hypothetical protein
MSDIGDPKRDFLRHALATLAYRGGKAVRDVPEHFASFKGAESSRSTLEILTHIGDLLDWMLHLCRGEHVWRDSNPDAWERQVDRFFARLRDLDEFLASAEERRSSPERLFQGPIADALTHIGQIALARRLSGVPVRGENYFKADIAAGRVGRNQAEPVYEFD